MTDNKLTGLRSLEEVGETYSEQEIMKKINEIPNWFHCVPLSTKITTPGVYNQKFYELILKTIPDDLTGKTVLDVGTRNGLYAFECERRNAKEVIAIDNWQGKSSSHGRPFFICREILDSQVEFIEMDFFEIEKLNKSFDVVLFLGVIYHLIDPLLAIRKLFSISKDLVILEGALLESPSPCCYYLDKAELNNDPSNRFLLTPKLIERYAKDSGFREVKFFGYIGTSGPIQSSLKYSNGKQPFLRNRGIFHLIK